MSAEYFQILRRMPVFGGLTDASLELLTGHACRVQCGENEYFFREQDKGDSMYILLSGSVIVERIWNGANVTLGKLGTGDCFGEMSLIDLMPRSASVRADSQCEALEIPQRCLYHLYKQDLEQYAILMMNMGREVSRRLRVTDQRLFELEQQLPEFAP